MYTLPSRILSFLLVVALFGLAVLPAEVRAAPPPGFSDEFDSSSLDPAWQVYVNTGPRVYGYPLPANHYSLTDSPGKLRYYVDPMTHYDGFLNGYQTGYYSCCIHDPGLEISREFSGDNWMFETKADFYLPYTNGRFFVPRIYFGDGGAGTYDLSFYAIRDLDQRYLAFQLARKTSADIASLEILEQTSVATPPSAPATITYYLQVERAGGVLTARWSDDGVNWQTAFTHDTGTALGGLAQRVTLAGLSWFNSYGSYADYDYVRLTPTNKAPNCSAAVPDKAAIWPPNHQFVPVTVQGVTDADGDQVTITVDSIWQDEPVNGTGDGDFAPDGKGVGTATAELRAERAAGSKQLPGNGRVYHVSFTAADGRSGTCTGTVTVGVPFSMGKTPAFIDEGALYDSTAEPTGLAATSAAVNGYMLFLPSVTH